MADENEGEDKTEEASAHKLAEARKKGNIAKTPELNQALSLIGAVATIAFFGPTLCLNLTEQLLPFIAHPQAHACRDLTKQLKQFLTTPEGYGGRAVDAG